ncbi:MAG: ATP-grasp domain-containing protein, partial [Flavobacteriales bacterium]|nr:ATP-grasp domain-containing protein [Flavobacteriales bacterium]
SIRNSPYKRDYKLIGFDYFPDTVGSFWCHKNYILPDILRKENEQEWLEEIVSIIKKDKIELLFIGVDFELPLFSKYKSRIEKESNCLVVVSDERVISIGNDKFKTFQFLKENGLYYPETYEPESCDFSMLTFPVIVKPKVGARSVGVSIVDSLDKLEEVLKNTQDPIIQEYVGDDNTEYTCGVISLDGELKHSIALNRTLKAGNTHLSSFSNDTPDIVKQYLKDITDELKPFGSCNYQLRVDTQGIPKLFEINARHSGTTYMRSLFGYNEIIYLLKKLLDDEEYVFNLKEGRAIRYFEEQLIK